MLHPFVCSLCLHWQDFLNTCGEAQGICQVQWHKRDVMGNYSTDSSALWRAVSLYGFSGTCEKHTVDLFLRLLGAFRMQRKMVLEGLSVFTGEKTPLMCRTYSKLTGSTAFLWVVIKDGAGRNRYKMVVGRGSTVPWAPVEKRKCKLRSEVIPLCVFIHPCQSSSYLLTSKGYPHTVYLFPKLYRTWAGWSTCPLFAV